MHGLYGASGVVETAINFLNHRNQGIINKKLLCHWAGIFYFSEVVFQMNL